MSQPAPRTEEAPHEVGAVALDGEDGDQDGHGDRHDERFEYRRRDIQPLDRAQHRDGRRDHAVTVEQGRAEDAEQHQRRRAPPRLRAPGEQGRQGQDAALAVIVGTHHDDDVLERDDEQQRVDDERQHAQHVLLRRRHRVRAEEALAHRVERARADVAVDDAEGGEREGEESVFERSVCHGCRRRGPAKPQVCPSWPRGVKPRWLRSLGSERIRGKSVEMP
jgi:hypothetical protein